MFGIKINEFDNSDGTVLSFNKIFPDTVLNGKHVEILDISEKKHLLSNSVYVRMIDVDGQIMEHDFGANNFINNEDFQLADNVRFKYFVKTLDGQLIAKGFTFKELANKLNCDINIVKSRFRKNVNKNYKTKYLFNVTRVEL